MKKVNFLVGENSTGKSSVLDIIEIIGDKNFWFFSPDLNYEADNSNTYMDLVSAASKNKKKFTLGAIDIDDNGLSAHGMLVTYSNHGNYPLITKVSIFNGQTTLIVHGDFSKGTIEKIYVKRIINTVKKTTNQEHKEYLISSHESQKGFKCDFIPERYTDAPILIIIREYLIRHKDKDDSENRFLIKARIPSYFSNDFVKIAPIRAMPKRTFDGAMLGFKSAGEHTPYLINRMIRRSEKFKKYVDDFGDQSGLFTSIETKQYGNSPAAPFELKINIGPTSLHLNNVGLGVSQSLPILVEIYLRQEETLFAIQQPEVHLHPRAQANFGSAIFKLAKETKKSFLIETHSDFTIDRFRIDCRKQGYIDSQILFFRKNEGFNTIDQIEILPDGSISDDQPEDYRDFFFNESLELIG